MNIWNKLIKNSNHINALAKLRAGNSNPRIESRRHCFPKIPEHLQMCQYCSSNEIENELIVFIFFYLTTLITLSVRN